MAGRFLVSPSPPCRWAATQQGALAGSLPRASAAMAAARTSPSTTSTRATWPPSAARPPSPTFKGHWSGFPAWVTWLVVHIFFLIGFRNRLAVFRQWAWTYLTFSDGVRLITGSQELPGWNETGEASGTVAAKPLDMASSKT